MESNEKLLKKIEVLEKEVLRLRDLTPISEKIWSNIAKFGGMALMFLPFVPNALFYIGLNETKSETEGSDYWFVVGGLLFFFGQRYIGELLNTLGKKLIDKLT